MARDRIKAITIRGLRCLADVRLEVGGLTVLVGDNGSGKSSIIEALEILRRAGTSGESFVAELQQSHSLDTLLAQRTDALELGVECTNGTQELSYRFRIERRGNDHRLVSERLTAATGADRTEVVLREPGRKIQVLGGSEGIVPENYAGLVLTAFGISPPSPAIGRVARALASFDVQLPFETLAGWAHAGRTRGRGNEVTLRQPTYLAPAERLERFGENLANAYHALKNEEHADAPWRDVVQAVQLGLGPEVEDVRTPQAGHGRITVAIKYRGLERAVTASDLSDGTLAYLCFVALVYLSRRGGSLLAFDEPEVHLHPALLQRVLASFESMTGEVPVVLATHSDRLLDGLADPAASVVLCELNAARQTVLRRPDRQALASWLEKYRGLGDLRAEGYEPLVYGDPAAP